jgi:hypothetical protein
MDNNTHYNDATYRTQTSVVFFISIMVVSVMAVDFAAVPAAAASGDDPAIADTDVSSFGDSGFFQTSSYTNAYLDDNGAEIDVVFEGQNVYLVGSDLDSASEDDTVNLREIDSFDGGTVESSSQVEQLTVEDAVDAEFPQAVIDETGSNDLAVEIDTSSLDAGDYFLRGAGDLLNNPDQDATFEVTVQSLDVAFDDNEVTNSGTDTQTDLDISSDRGTHSLNMSADGDLDDEELYNILVDTSEGASIRTTIRPL